MRETSDREGLYMDVMEVQKKHVESFNCVICGVAGSRGQMLGGRIESLCNYHNNEWLVYARGQDLWIQYIDLSAEYDVAIHSGDEEFAKAVARTRDGVLRALYDLSGEWVGRAIEENDTNVVEPRFAQEGKDG